MKMDKLQNGLFGNQSREVNIRHLINKYLRYWYWFVICCFIFLLAAFLYIRYNITSEYLISTTLLIKEDNSVGPLKGEGFSGGMFGYGMDKTVGSEMIILRSRSLMERVFEELALNTSYYIEGRVKDIEVYKEDISFSVLINKLDPSAYGKIIKLTGREEANFFELTEYDEEGKPMVNNYKFGQEINRPYATFTVIGSSESEINTDIIVYFHDLKELAKVYSQMLQVELVSKDANVLYLGITEAVPERGIVILEKLVEVYQKEAIENKNQVQLSTIDFLDERIQFLSTELSKVEKNVETYKRENDLTDVSSNAELYVQSASQYNKELESLEIQSSIINSLEDYVNKNELRLIPATLYLEEPMLNGLMAKFNELLLEKQRMLRTIQPGSSLISNLDEQLTNLRENIRDNLLTIKNNMEITLNNLRASTSQFQSKVQNVPSIERELLEINRQQSVKQAIYLFLLQNREKAGLDLASSQANSRIIDEPAKEDVPINTSESTFYLGALSLGLFVPFGFIYLLDVLNNKVIERKDVEGKLKVPILGEICHSKDKALLQVSDGDHSIVVETFRLVRANLHFANVGKENKVFLVTSSRSGEGKTFFSINLGASLALTGKKTVILRFDFRKPKLMEALGLDSEIGLTDYLVSPGLPIDSLLKSVPGINGLFAIGSGSIPPNPAELMLSSKISSFFEELKEQFDYIVVDSSPIGQVSDTYNLATYIDATLYIVRYNYSYKAQLAIIEDVHHYQKLRQPMIVLNDARKKNTPVYGYGYGYSNAN